MANDLQVTLESHLACMLSEVTIAVLPCDARPHKSSSRVHWLHV